LRLEVSGTRPPSLTLPLVGGGQDGGEILLAEQGVYQPEGRPVWQIGELRLTGERLLFLQPRGVIFDTPLTLITEVATESKRFTLVRKMAMAVSYRHPRQMSLAKAWFITPSLGRWLEQLRQMVSEQSPPPEQRNMGVREQGSAGAAEISPAPQPSITHAQVERLAMELDLGSREIVWHLWLNRHATIGELAALIAAPTHMDVLFKIRQGINPVAEEVLGRPILVFEESRFDRETGEMVPFSWWLAGKAMPVTEGWEPRIEVFNEAHEINVIVELAGVEEEAIRVRAQREKVVVWVDDSGASYHEEVPLPAPVDADRVATRFKNGILIVNLKKACTEPGRSI
jgi:HSP20 family molecular chaperone IbpA